MRLKDLPIGIQTFRKIIQEDFLYVDKTQDLYELVRLRGGAFFFSRPRRFGKSVLISTLEEIFKGNRELFQGLWLDQAEYSWEKYPVIRIDFSTYHKDQDLKEYIIEKLNRIADAYQVSLNREQDYVLQFEELIQSLAQLDKFENRRVVILVDEYDKPLLQFINNVELAKENRDILKSFYTVLKALDEKLRFVFLTGVSKFSKVGVFSGLNHLEDLSMRPDYATLVGWTQEELQQNFDFDLKQLAKEYEISLDEVIKKTRFWYNGYRFTLRNLRVYNPFSSLLLFRSKVFKNHWFESGTPTFLLNLLKEKKYNLWNLHNLELQEEFFSTYEIEDLKIEPLLFQTGYLTIQDYDAEEMEYTLGYPNFEVKRSFTYQLFDAVESVPKEAAKGYTKKLLLSLKEEDLKEFFLILRVFFAKIPYNIQLQKERYVQSIFYLIFTILGLDVQTEVHTNRGRIDAVIELEELVYLFEFKLEDSKESALAQIKSKQYYTPYLNQGKTIYLVGVSFQRETREIEDYLVERLEEN